MQPIFPLVLAYIACHLALFVCFRRRALLQQERGIFLFHASSFLLLAIVLIICLSVEPTGKTVAVVVASLALHGIYSLSFLELWALSKTGFSLRLLANLDQTGPRTMADIVSDQTRLSDQKKVDRIHSLLALGLVHETSRGYSLTARGRWIAASIEALARLAGMRELG
jgi:hypothetical protein